MNPKELRQIRIEMAATLISSEDGNKFAKAAIVEAFCDEDVVILRVLREMGFCGIHFEWLDSEGDCPACLMAESIVAAEVAEARAMQQSQEILENDDFFGES